jgi:hypothetical protein
MANRWADPLDLIAFFYLIIIADADWRIEDERGKAK